MIFLNSCIAWREGKEKSEIGCQKKGRVLFANSTADQGNNAAEGPRTQAAAMNKKDLECRKGKF